MTLTTDIQSTIPQLVADLRTAEKRADDKLRGINNRGTRDLLRLARAIVHVKTGRLQAGLIVEGPFNIATGTLEGRVSAPGVPYAADEFGRGGTHDTPARVLDEGQDIINQVAQDMEDALIRIIEGRE